MSRVIFPGKSGCSGGAAGGKILAMARVGIMHRIGHPPGRFPGDDRQFSFYPDDA